MNENKEAPSSYTRTPQHSNLSALDPSSPKLAQRHITVNLEPRFISPPSSSQRKTVNTTPSTSVPHTPNTNPPPQRLVNRVLSSENLGLITLFMRASPIPPPRRSEEVTQRVRLNISRVYLKYVIEVLLYLLCTYIAVQALTFCCKLLGWYVLPLTILCAFQLAARRMNSGRNPLHEVHGAQHYSLTRDIKGATKHFQKGIDYSTNFALRLFDFIPQRLAQTSWLDRQMAHIPNYSSNRGYR